MSLNEEIILLAIGGMIGLISAIAGAIIQYMLDMRKHRLQWRDEIQKQLDQDSREVEKELLVELGRLSARLPNKVNFTGLSPSDNAIVLANRLKERRENPELYKDDKTISVISKGDISFCSSCGKENEPGAYFCSRCGTVLKVEIKDTPILTNVSQISSEKPNIIVCPSCGEENKFDAIFCDNCGDLLKITIKKVVYDSDEFPKDTS